MNAIIQNKGEAADLRAHAAAAVSKVPGVPWPTIAPDAFHGVAGEYIRTIEADTESDPVALLVQFLVLFGASVGRNPHVPVEGSRHCANLFALLVGETSKGRKGTSLSRARAPFDMIEDSPRSVSGLTSGEGLKYHVRDDSEDRNGNPLPGVSDKRLLIVETEFAQALATASRAGVTLSPAIREAWDSGNLSTLTRNDPVRATGAHISIIGHIVADELRLLLGASDRANGFANRFLFVASRRAQALPFGGAATPESVVLGFASRLRAAATTARSRGAMVMDDRARELWIEAYTLLSEGHEGLLGAVTARSEAQVLRLALVYALLAEADKIREEHLLAALALWSYCEDSARYIFQQVTGDPVADKIIAALRGAGEAGLTMTRIHDALGRNSPAVRVADALKRLSNRGLARLDTHHSGGRGRPTDRWFATNE